ncbi:phosphotriesterase [Chloroflexota bacterium]
MIITVNGGVEPQDLGIVAMCENILYGLMGWENDPWIIFNRPEAYDAIVSSLQEFQDAGGKTIVDCSGMLVGRDAELLMNIASSAKIHIVASTGFGSQDCIPGHFVNPLSRRRQWRDKSQGKIEVNMPVPDADFLAGMFYDELTKGMVAPGMRHIKSKAGIVKAASSWEQITEIEELSLRGAALAAKRAGVAVITGGINQARRQMDIMLEEGLEPDRIVIGHCDDGRAIDLERDKEFAQQGAYVAYDHIGWEDASVPYGIPDERRLELVKAMVEAGFAERIVLSCNTIGYAIDVPQPKHSFGYLLQSFVPKLKKAGLSDSKIGTILIDNPKHILNGKTNL